MIKILNNDYFLSLISKCSNILFGFLSLVLLNRFLGTTLKGEYSVIINYVTIISSIFQLGISIVYPKFKRKKIENCYEIFLSLSFIQFLIYIFLSLVVYKIFNMDCNVLYILIISSISILTTQLRYINLVENIKYNTFVVIVMSVSNFIVTLIAFLLFKRNLVVALSIYLLKDFVIIFMYLIKLNKIKLFKKKYITYYKQIIFNGFLPMLSNLLIVLNYKIDILMLDGFDIDYKLIGLYSLGISISEYIWIIPDIFKDVVQKRIADGNSIDTINFSLRCSSTLVCICYFILILLGDKLFGFVFGYDFVGAYKITKILFIGIYSMIFYKIIGQLFIVDDKSKQYFMILLIGIIMNIICNFILIPIIDIYGAALATILSYTIIGIIFLEIYLKNYKIKIKDILFLKKTDIFNIKEIIFRKKVK